MYHIIINPAAGSGRGLAVAERIKRIMDQSGKIYRMLYTKGTMDAAELAANSCEAGGEAVIGIGGDGTIQEIVAGMFFKANNKPLPLGILPCGSGNDFALSLGLNKKQIKDDESITAWLMSGINKNKTRFVDIIRVNGKAYLNIANIGLDALIVHNAAGLKKTFGRNAYLAAAFTSILQHKNIKMQIDINGQILRDDFTLIAVCNGQYYGGGMRIAPQASIDDGMITVCLVRCETRPKLMLLFPTILVEKHTKLKEVVYMQCKNLTVKLETKQALCMDGNLCDVTDTFNFEITPRALRIFS